MNLTDWKDWTKRRDALATLKIEQLVLLAVHWARSVYHHWEEVFPEDKRVIQAIELAEDVVFGKNSNHAAYAAAYAANAAHDAACNAAYAAYYTACAAHTVVYNVVNVAHCAAHTTNAAHTVAYAADYYESSYKDFLATKPKQIPTTPTIIDLVNSIKETRNTEAMPILADALEDAGCIDVDLLRHLREDRCHLADGVLWT